MLNLEMDLSERRFPEIPEPHDFSPTGEFNNTIGTYLKDFLRVDPDHKIEKKLAELKIAKAPIVIDLMATTTALNGLQTMWGIRGGRMLAVGIHDERGKVRYQEDEEEDGIFFIEGDLNEADTWKKIRKWLNSDRSVHFKRM